MGIRLRDRLLEHYGSEESALEAIQKGDVADLLKVISERQAVSLAQFACGMTYGVSPADFLATEEAFQIYQRLISRISRYAHTEYARRKVMIFFPTANRDLLMEWRRLADSAIRNAQALEGSGIGSLLTKVRPLKKRSSERVRNRAVVVSSTADLEKMKARGLDRLIDLHLVEDIRELKDIVTGYDHVCVLGDGLDFPMAEIEHADSVSDWYLVPEAVLCFYTDNLDVLEPAIKAAMLLESSAIIRFDGLVELDKLIRRLDDCDDPETRRLSSIIERLESSTEEALSWANSELARRIRSSSITLDGGDVLQALSRGSGVREIFESRMKETFSEVLVEAKGQAASNLDLTELESTYLDDVFPSEVQYPLDIDRQSLIQFLFELRRKLEARRLLSRRELARELSDKKEIFERIVSELLEFDVSYMLGSFGRTEGLFMPGFVEETALWFEDGKNLFIEDAEPVSYSVGETGLTEHSERVVILSGVNSGGKTSLIELIAEIVILAHMGMPVPAISCNFCIFEEMYYFGKSKGTLSAGAFESAMRKFSMVETDKKKLVLADELEAITEPGASAKIIGCMLDELNRRDSVSVFVSHLAEEIVRFVETPVRVDGIEAEGLDSNNNLIVRRSPRYNYLAKSTPELILDRLVRTTEGSEQEFYKRLLGKFE